MLTQSTERNVDIYDEAHRTGYGTQSGISHQTAAYTSRDMSALALAIVMALGPLSVYTIFGS